MADSILEVKAVELLQQLRPPNILVAPVKETVVLEKLIQGPPGRPGKDLTTEDTFLVENRLGEISGDAEAQEEAQHNLGLGQVDPLAYYILAKS